MTLAGLLEEGWKTLQAAGISEARLDAWLLLEYVTGYSRAYYYAHPEEEVCEVQAEAYRSLIGRRGERRPLQHLTHEAFFMGHSFYVDEHVLIPRQDTEVLVEEALKVMKEVPAPRVLDMCTGSGCILLSLLAEKPEATGVGADLSPEALAVARRNAASLLGTEAFAPGEQAGPRVALVESDLFGSPFFSGKDDTERPTYDIIVSNPPYIATGVIPKLQAEVRDHDPCLALDGGEDGLTFYRRITEASSAFLREGGWLLYEIGADQGEAVEALLRREGFGQIAVKKDLAGLDRVVLGQRRLKEAEVSRHV